MGGWERRTLFVLVLLLLETVPVGSKRGGIAIGRSRGASPARNRGSSGGFGGGGGGGGGGSAPNYGKPNQNMYNRQTNYGNIGGSQGGQGWNAHNRQQGGWGSGGHGYQGGHYNMKPQTSRYTSSGKGSFIRSNQFKNMIVGAAAGYLTYQAGKAIIRAATGPMMWQNRPYYWGQSYYQPRPGYSQMCHMPIDASDQQFGNVYFQDQTRPREIVWGCGRYESCCGYECCPSSAPSRNFGLGLGAIILLVVSLGCVGICLYKCCRPPFTFFNQREKYSPGRQFNEGYNPGEACGGGEEGNGAPPAYY